MDDEGGSNERPVAWYRAMLDASTEALLVLDDDGTVEFANAAVGDVLGRSPDELAGTALAAVVHEDDEAELGDLLADAVATDTADLRVEHADGTVRHVTVTRADVSDDAPIDGTVVGFHDVTDRRERAEELATYETVVRTAPVGLFTLDEDGRITWANGVFADVLDIPREDLVGTDFGDLVASGYYDPETVETYLEQVRRLLSDDNDVDRATYRVETHTDDGTLVHDAYVALLPLEDGEFRGTVIAFRDVTQERASQRELERQNERLDQFASVVSHDLRNPLGVAKGRLQLARQTGDLDHLDAIADAHDRMESLIEGLLSVAREGRSLENPTDVSLASAAEAAWETVDTGEATCSISPDLGSVTADPERLQRLLENLFRNSVEHGGDDVAVTVGARSDGAGFYVADDGPGIPSEDRERVFEQGYSTTAEGTGFGLRIVDSIAETHGWSVRATESEDGGARIEILTGD